MSVLNELMKFDRSVVISSRNKITDSTPLHIATEGGHYEVVKLLMDAGASASDENKVRNGQDDQGGIAVHSSRHLLRWATPRSTSPLNMGTWS